MMLYALLLLAQCPHSSPAMPLREYRVDFGHSILEFSIKFTFVRVKGRFTDGNGILLYDEASPQRSSITMVIDAHTIDTGSPHRDDHLRSSDFFGVEQFPTIVFQSRRVTQTSDGWIAEGDLTMHGTTRSVTLPFQFVQSPVRSPDSRWMVMGIAGAKRLARADFGITGGSAHNSWFTAARAATMGDSVDISYELEVYSPDAQSQRSPGIDAVLQRIDSAGMQAYVARLREMQRTKSAAEFAPYLVGLDLVARALLGSCRLADALTLSQAVTELFPESHGARLTRAFLLDVRGERRGAAAEYARAKVLFKPPVRDPNEKFPQVDDTWWYADQLVRAALEWGYKQQALSLARALAELYPETARALTMYGQTLAAVGDAAGAAAAYDRALLVDAREAGALEWRRRLPR
ncbi:MAG TPA: YceI family protein [Gemmatimonadales bacterium]|jgi:polyisoprenoid-binding protein YceI